MLMGGLAGSGPLGGSRGENLVNGRFSPRQRKTVNFSEKIHCLQSCRPAGRPCRRRRRFRQTPERIYGSVTTLFGRAAGKWLFPRDWCWEERGVLLVFLLIGLAASKNAPSVDFAQAFFRWLISPQQLSFIFFTSS